MPTLRSLDIAGLNLTEKTVQALMSVVPEEWMRELEPIRQYYDFIGERLPVELRTQLSELQDRAFSWITRILYFFLFFFFFFFFLNCFSSTLHIYLFYFFLCLYFPYSMC